MQVELEAHNGDARTSDVKNLIRAIQATWETGFARSRLTVPKKCLTIEQ